MEFLRFGSSIPGAYWGCCAADIIQNFKMSPDAPYAVEVVSGDSGAATGQFVGKTYKEVFLQRLRFGTFGTRDMPNHAFFAILTEWQINSGVGKEWLAILKECGFEFFRTVNNSVYSGGAVGGVPSSTASHNDNHIFVLIRNIGTSNVKDQFTPPKAWTSLPKVVEETWEHLDLKGSELTKTVYEGQKAAWGKLPKISILSEKQLDELGIEPTLSGQRSGGSQMNGYEFVASGGAPQELRSLRKKRIAERQAMMVAPPAQNAFPTKAVAK